MVIGHSHGVYFQDVGTKFVSNMFLISENNKLKKEIEKLKKIIKELNPNYSLDKEDII